MGFFVNTYASKVKNSESAVFAHLKKDFKLYEGHDDSTF